MCDVCISVFSWKIFWCDLRRMLWFIGFSDDHRAQQLSSAKTPCFTARRIFRSCSGIMPTPTKGTPEHMLVWTVPGNIPVDPHSKFFYQKCCEGSNTKWDKKGNKTYKSWTLNSSPSSKENQGDNFCLQTNWITKTLWRSWDTTSTNEPGRDERRHTRKRSWNCCTQVLGTYMCSYMYIYTIDLP